MNPRSIAAITALAALVITLPLAAQHQHEHGAGNMTPDTRIAVSLPETERVHILANMRDHLASLQQIQAALAAGKFELSAEIAEHHLGMTSLKMHGASDLAPHMPAAMQAIGTEMHHAASRFALEATNATVSGDVRAPLASLAKVTAQCVACHGAYRVH